MSIEDQSSLVGRASTKPSWDPAGGRANRIPRPPMPFEALDTPFRIRRASEQTAFAAGFIAVSNGLSAALTIFDHTPPHTLLGSDPWLLAGVQTCLALAAAWIAVRSRRRPGVGLATLVLVWSVLEAIPWALLKLYGHGVVNPRYLPLLGLFVVLAFIGLRGALAQRKITAAPLKLA